MSVPLAANVGEGSFEKNQVWLHKDARDALADWLIDRV